MKKRVLAAIMTAMMVAALAGCAGEGTGGGTAATGASQAAPAAEASTAGAEESAAPADTASTEAPAETTGEKKVVRIGLQAPLSGAVASQGAMMQAGLETAIEYFNENIGFKNHPEVEVEVVIVDTESNVDTGVAAFERLATVDNVDVVMGCYQSGIANPSAALAIKYEVPYMICNCVSDNILSENSNWVFRATLGDACEEGGHVEMMAGLQELIGIKSMAFISTADDFGNSALAIYRRMSETLGIDIAVEEMVQAGAADLSGSVQRIKNANPDICVVVLQLNEALLFVRQMKEYQCDVPMLAKGAGFNDVTFVEASQGAAEGAISATGWVPTSVQFLSDEAKVVADQIASHNNGQFPNEVGANGFMVGGIILDAIDRVEGEITRESLAAAFDATDLDQDHWCNMLFRHPRISFSDEERNGMMIYNQNWDAKLQYGQLQNGEWVNVYPFSLVGDPGSDTNPLVFPWTGE